MNAVTLLNELAENVKKYFNIRQHIYAYMELYGDRPTKNDYAQLEECAVRCHKLADKYLTNKDLLEDGGWRPIEDAPKDGTFILAIVAGNHPVSGRPFVPDVVVWNDEFGMWLNDSVRAAFDSIDYDNSNHCYNPTHYRDLPAPPKENS